MWCTVIYSFVDHLSNTDMKNVTTIANIGHAKLFMNGVNILL